MPALSRLIGLTLYHPFVPVAVFPTERRQAGWVGSAPVQARDPRRPWAVSGDTTRRLGSDDGQRLEHVLGSAAGPSGWTPGRPEPVLWGTGPRNYTVSP